MFKKKPSIKPQSSLRSSDRRKLAQQIIRDLSYAPPLPPAPTAVTITASSATAEDQQQRQQQQQQQQQPGEAAVRNMLLPEGTAAAKFTTTHGPNLAPVNGTIYLGTHAAVAAAVPAEGSGSSNGGNTSGTDFHDANERPLWIRVDRTVPELFPTVYTLWRNPRLLPLLRTHPDVVERLCDGADLMVPGLIGPPFPTAATCGALVGIAGSDRPSVPIAVGVCDLDVSALAKAVGERGRAVRVLHWVGDEIYRLGGHPPGRLPDTLDVVEEQPPDAEAEVTKGVQSLDLASTEELDKGREQEMEKARPKPGDGNGGEADARQLTTKEIDDAFYSAALYGFQDYARRQKTATLEFPLSSSAFISQLVHPFLPPASYFPPNSPLQQPPSAGPGPHPGLQLKKTSWKNAARFLKHLQAKQLVLTKLRNGGESVVTEVNWEHDAITTFRPYKLPQAPSVAAAAASDSGGAGGPSAGAELGENASAISVEALYRPNGRGAKFFEECNAGTKDFYTAADLRALLYDYCNTRELVQPNNKRLVKLDPTLTNALFTNTTADAAELAKCKGVHKRDQLVERLVQSCAPFYRVTTNSVDGGSSGQQKPKSGAPPKVTVVMERRQGKKSVTRMHGLEPFGVDPRQLADELQKVCAGSATVGQGMGLKPGLLEVLVQGSQSAVVAKALARRGVAAKFIAVVDKTGGKK